MTAPFDPDNPALRAERLALEEANWSHCCAEWAKLPPSPPCIPLGVGNFDANGNAKGSGWWL